MVIVVPIIDVTDPYNATIHVEGLGDRRGSPLTAAALRSADLVLIVTDHSAFDYKTIVRHARLVLDTRNATRGLRAPRGRVHRL